MMMDNMLGEIKEVMMESMYESYFPQVEEIVLKRWEKMNIPLHCLGFALSPRFYNTHYLEKLAPGGIRRKAPNLDKEVIQGVMQAFNRIAENKDEERLLREQFATFHMKRGLYALPSAQMDAVTIEAIDWWSTYGAEAPDLAVLAKKIVTSRFSEAYKEGPHKKWDMNPESRYLEGSSSLLEDMDWEVLEEDEDRDSGKGKNKG
uniref:HAT C-terminal dimerisation domain-containing protein n=1 Tax=Lactuca sativa TaxID=4236 RepID=A0A9R1W6K6_LACSA|nr:hypothetical protein LSAT_V11C300103780 [Lactuca sativa]